MLEGYNGELTIIITCERKQTKHTLFEQSNIEVTFFISPFGDRTAILCGHLSQMAVPSFLSDGRDNRSVGVE